MTDWTAEYLKIISDCEQRQSKLSSWEEGYLDSVRDQIERGRTPSAKQLEKLDEIWERVTKHG